MLDELFAARINSQHSDNHKMKIKFIPPVIILAGAVGFMVWFFASGAAMPGG